MSLNGVLSPMGYFLLFFAVLGLLFFGGLEWREHRERRALDKALNALSAAHDCLSRDPTRLQAAKDYVAFAEKVLKSYPRYAVALETNIKVTREMIMWCEIRLVSDD